MRVLLRIACVVWLSVGPLRMYAQYPEASPTGLCTAYSAIVSCPDGVNQYRFFSAFPNRGEELMLLYEGKTLVRGMDCDLHSVRTEHIAAFWNLPQVNDSVFAEKAVRITCGLRPGSGTARCWLRFLREAFLVESKAQCILNEIAQLRKGHQMEFWGFLWAASDADVLYEQNRGFVQQCYLHLLMVYDKSYSVFRCGGSSR